MVFVTGPRPAGKPGSKADGENRPLVGTADIEMSSFHLEPTGRTGWATGKAKSAAILIVDDEPANLQLLQYVLRSAGYLHCQTTTDPRRFLSLLREFEPDLVILDLVMPHLDGLALLKQLTSRTDSAGGFLPVLVVTSDASEKARRAALTAGARDFLTKPLDPAEVILRVNNLLETRFLYRELQRRSELLEETIGERDEKLEEAHLETLRCLAAVAEFRDDNTGRHTQRVGELAGRLARSVGLPEKQVELIRLASPLHDIGKIGIPDYILLKPGSLTHEEFALVKTHTTIGVQILSGSRSPVLHLAEEIALYHHERWDGTGYSGIRGEEIPLAARIATIADVFDVLTHDRPYKTSWPLEKALEEFRSQCGKQFDRNLVEVLLNDPLLVEATSGELFTPHPGRLS